MQEVYDFLKQAGTFYLATDEGGQPHIRPFSNIDIFEGKLYMQTGKVKTVSKQLIANPRVEICVCVGDAWLRIEANAVTDESVAAKQHMIDANPLLKDWFKADDGNTHVLYLADATATFASLFGDPKVLQF
ncbi:MAG: pyridoxamine 5'-phosphate oxidase family protein [Oscillospiraceae bacterium]|nr:pyridoxamine 5'-phosphate oxidase family protein [Oscillospiraceae bacterium]